MSAPPPPNASTGMRGRPISKLRTIDETAEILNVSTKTVHRLVGSKAEGAQVSSARSHSRRIPIDATKSIRPSNREYESWN
jgi:hypothetical protein